MRSLTNVSSNTEELQLQYDIILSVVGKDVDLLQKLRKSSASFLIVISLTYVGYQSVMP